MNDSYPSTDEEQTLHLDFAYPDARQGTEPLAAARQMVSGDSALRRALLLYLGAIVVVIGAWFAILFTGRYPRGMFHYVEGVIRWHNRVVGYAFVLVTDQYPPFRLRP